MSSRCETDIICGYGDGTRWETRRRQGFPAPGWRLTEPARGPPGARHTRPDVLDERYRSASAVWSGQPNPILVAEAADISPGAALDVGCGEGADAIWLAERGWQVTAIDISTVALQRGAAQAHQVGPEVGERITWVCEDVTSWVSPTAYDLVSAQFMQLPTPQRELLHRGLAASVAPGGILLIVGHHPSDLRTTARRPRLPELFFTAQEVAATLDALDTEWEIVADEARGRSTSDPEGRTVTIRDTVLKARRLTSRTGDH